MKTIELYAAYSEEMRKMNVLYTSYEELIANEAPIAERNEVDGEIKKCRQALASILQKIMHKNPFSEEQDRKSSTT